jgi:Big-like domain-containing protein
MRSVRIVIGAMAFVGMLLGGSLSAQALVDDLEDDFWTGFTHFHLGDRATAGYSTAFAKSGTRSYHVEISGWTVRDFGSAFGYAYFPTRKAPITELRLSLLYDRLEDTVSSVWDAHASGVSIDLLDGRLRSVGSLRYITEYAGSRNGGRCAPTTSDVVLDTAADMGTWSDVGRNPAVDFPAAPWASAEVVRISIGFLCAAGLTGALYSLYFDDFFLDTGAGDSDGDGLRDLDEEARVYSAKVTSAAGPWSLGPGQSIGVDVAIPPVSGAFASAAVDLEIDHPQVDDLSLELHLSTPQGSRSALLWDPGLQVRGAAIQSPSNGSAVHGIVEVQGRAWRPHAIVHVHVDTVSIGVTEADSTGAFRLAWNSDDWAEGPQRLFLIAQAHEGGEFAVRTSHETTVIVDRTPPDLQVLSPQTGSTLSGVVLISAALFDGQGIAAVEVWIDGARVDSRDDDLYVFPYDTLDLSNDVHTFEVRARDVAGNEAVRAFTARVTNNANVPPLVCPPRCNTTAATSTGNLPQMLLGTPARVLPLPSGDRLEISEGFRVPWQPALLRTGTGVHLILDAMRPSELSESNGLLGSDLAPADFEAATSWHILVHNHGGAGGSIRGVSALLALRTFPGVPDTDRDGLFDGGERGTLGTVPVLRDTDGDALSDGQESGPRLVRFSIDGGMFDRVIQTDPLDFDTDHDGLPDGLELAPGDPENPSDPMDVDTDDDGLLDGAERLMYGSDPTLTDTDGETLSDFSEVTARELRIVIDRLPLVRLVTTSPASIDTDLDGIPDNEEWNGEALFGFATDPSEADTDRDGLADLDEFQGLTRKPTNPLLSDTDSDGVVDGLDLSPTEYWVPEWKTTFEPGLVRFTQRFHALGVQPVSATIWTYNVADNSCVYLSDHTADATRSSDESSENILATINRVLAEGGESNFTATRAENLGREGGGTATSAYGACDFFHPRQYRFEYWHFSRAADVNFVNTAEVSIRDDAGLLFYSTALEVPVRLAKQQSIDIQLSIHPDADRGDETVVPALVYSLVRGSEFLVTPPFYRNLAIGTPLDDHSYQFTLRIPRDVTTEENVTLLHGVPTAELMLMPMWLTTSPSGTTRSALDASRVSVAAMISRVQESAEAVIARLATGLEALVAALPTSIASFASGRYLFGSSDVYVYHLGDAFDVGAPSSVDAVYLVGESPEEVATFQETINWTPADAWVRESRDGFGVFVKVLKIVRSGISSTSQIIATMLSPVLSVPSSGTEQITFGRTSFVITKLTSIETGQPYYVIGATSVDTVKIRAPHPEIPGVMLTEVRTIERGLPGEIVDNLDDSTLLKGVKYATLRSALRGAAVGATLAVFGTQAVVAFRDGDAIKGAVFAIAGAAVTFGIIKSDVALIERAFEIGNKGVVFRVKLGTVALIAVTGILASYELFRAGQTDNPIERLSHYEGAGGLVLDSIVAAVPLYGAAAMLGWQLGLNIAIGARALLGVMPDPLAVRIVSTPGSTMVFLFEYVFATDIPSEVAENALSQLLSFLAEQARYNNSLDSPVPTLLLVP